MAEQIGALPRCPNALRRVVSAGRSRPRLLLLLAAQGLVALALSPPAAVAAVGDCAPSPSWGTVDRSLAGQVLQLVNDHRTAMGLAALATAPTLTASAEWKSLHMAGYGYMAHDDPAPPVARTVAQRLDACGYPSSGAGWGENIAYGYPDAASVMNGWLNSPGHRANIETPGFTTIGIGAARSGSGTLYWTQDFGTTGASVQPPSDTQAPTVPSGLSVTPGTTTLTASWQAAADNVGVAGYGVYLNGSLAGSVVGAGATVSGLTCGTTYTIAVDAFDAAGNRSGTAGGSVSTGACSAPPPPPPPPAGAPSSGGAPPPPAPAFSSPSGTSTPPAPTPSADLTTRSTDTPAPSAPASTAPTGPATHDAAKQAPAAPALGQIVGRTRTSISLRWHPSSGKAGERYRIYLNGRALRTVKLTKLTLTGLSCRSSYTIAIAALGAAGNESSKLTLHARKTACTTG